MTDYIPETDVAAYLDKKFGKGRWRFTSEYRSPAREDALRAEGAGTVASGQTSAHSRGKPGAAGAVDLQVEGMSAGEVASAMKDGPFTKEFAEGRHAGQGAHVHAEPIPALPAGFKLDSVPEVEGKPAAAESEPPLPKGFTLDAAPKPPAPAPPKPTPRQRASLADEVVTAAKIQAQGLSEDVGARVKQAADQIAADYTPPSPNSLADVMRYVVRQAGEPATAAVDLMAYASAPIVGALDYGLGRPVEAATGVRRQVVGDLASLAIPAVGDTLEGAALARRAGTAGVAPETLRIAEAAKAPNSLAAITKPQRTAIPDAHTADVKALHDEGVRMTPGQIKGGTDREVEAKRTSDPHTGPAIRQQVQQSMDDYNRAIYRKDLKIAGLDYPKDGPVGHDGVEAVYKALSGAYDAIKPKLRAAKDEPLDQDIAAARTEAGVKGSREQKEFDALVNGRIKQAFGKTGTMDGETFKTLESYLTGEIKAYKNGDAYQRKLGNALDDVLDGLRASQERHSDPSVRGQLQRVNSAYAGYKRLEDAAVVAKGNDGKFTPAQFLGSLAKGGARNRSMVARGKGQFQDFTRAAQRVLPDKYPDSGTAGRTLANRGIGMTSGAALGAGLGAQVAGDIGMGVGAALGGAAGRAVDVAAAPTTNTLARVMLDRQSARQLQRRGIVQRPEPTNYLRAVNRRALAAPPVAAISNQAQQ